MERSKAEVERATRDQLDAMFVNLADRWDLKTGDVDPMDAHRWELTVAVIVDHVWRWYRNNRPREYVTVVLEVPAGLAVDQLLAVRLLDDEIGITATYPGDLVTDDERQA